jgi:hypothetical protein
LKENLLKEEVVIFGFFIEMVINGFAILDLGIFVYTRVGVVFLLSCCELPAI